MIDKTDYADEYRLSSTGRILPALANTARDATYVRGDAYNLLHATEGNDFEKIPQFTDEIISQLRVEILNIHAAMEKIGRVKTINSYIDNFEQWRKIIADTIQIVTRTEERLDSTSFRDDFEAWLDKPTNNSTLTFNALYNEILRVRQVLATFNRLLSELVHVAIKERRNTIAPPSFKGFAEQLVRNPFSPAVEKHFFRQWGACKLETPFHSVFDGTGAAPIRDLPEKPGALVFTDEVIEPASDLGKLRFLDCHGKEIVKRLQAGPVMLSRAIADGLFVVDDDVLIGDLVGIFVTPDTLHIDGSIEIRVTSGLIHRTIKDDDYLFTDLELVLMETKK